MTCAEALPLHFELEGDGRERLRAGGVGAPKHKTGSWCSAPGHFGRPPARKERALEYAERRAAKGRKTLLGALRRKYECPYLLRSFLL
jgi:hypothetical protein